MLGIAWLFSPPETTLEKAASIPLFDERQFEGDRLPSSGLVQDVEEPVAVESLREPIEPSSGGDDAWAPQERLLAHEPADPLWSEGTEALLESIVASSGGRYDEMRATCRTTICRIELRHNEKREALREVGQDRRTITRALRPVIEQNFPRLQVISGATVPDDWPSGVEGRLVTRFYLTGADFESSLKKIDEAVNE